MQRAYTIEYLENGIFETSKDCIVMADSKENAYKKFMELTEWKMYSAWVAKVTYKSGMTKEFNTFSGKPY